MFDLITKKFILPVVFGALLLPDLALAATPTAYMEQANIIAQGRTVRAYRIPTKDMNGKIKYYDLTVAFNILDNGRIDTTTSTMSTGLSPNLAANKFIPGTYKSQNGDTTCKLTATVLTGGRQQGALSCKKGPREGIYYMSVSWVSGPIAGHPFQPDLLAAGIDKIPGYQNFSWGKIGNTYLEHQFGCMGTGEISSATQVGNSINVSGYENSNIQKCGLTLLKQ